ncbi:MAG: phosphoenolpyruvate-protein phosphotransferase [Isosphaeraceae bacterium]|jgi:phosphotransferase system enzyme I (PtsI)|nr:MAG: phosphoenolpyruvate-protein phosphotransferase [Isosphaeraceae bacterium]
MTGTPGVTTGGTAGPGDRSLRDDPAVCLTGPGSPRAPLAVLQGIPVSPGLAIGPVVAINPRGLSLPSLSSPTDPQRELARLDAALEGARREAEAAEREATARLGFGYGEILGAHARMIVDPTLRREAAARIEHEGLDAEHAVYDVLESIAGRLESLADPHLAARAADVRDIQQRILGRLGHTDAQASTDPNGPPEPSVLLAHDLSPSETARLNPGRVLGFATEVGGPTSHTAIVAAGLEIPAVVGLGPFLDLARRARLAIVDGDQGIVILDPDPETLAHYRRVAADRAARFAGLGRLADLPAETRDGVRIELLGNIEFPEEVELCRARGAAGIGLFRTEFLFLNAERPPSEEEQFAAYAQVVRAMGGLPVTIRTLDLGADKFPHGRSRGVAEPNPNLGLRSLRLSLRDLDWFRIQLRAILRAAAEGPLQVLFPLVSTLGEWRDARDLLDREALSLRRAGVPVPADLRVGAMIEVPAAALMADLLAKEVDFFSIGTNDLIQYTLAADRTNESVAYLYNAADPAVLRLLQVVVEAARPRGVPVNVCGMMGGDPLYTSLLLGLGLRQLSMPPHQLLEVKRVVRAIDMGEAEALARELLTLDTADAVQRRLRDELARLAPDALAGRSPDSPRLHPRH